MLQRSERKPFVDKEQALAYLRREAVKVIKSTLPKGTKIRTKVRFGEDGHMIIDAIASPPPSCKFVDVELTGLGRSKGGSK